MREPRLNWAGVCLAEPRKPTTVRIAGWSARHRWLVLALWFVGTIGLFVASQSLGGVATQGATNASAFSRTESAQGDQIWSDANRQSEPGEDFLVVLTGGSGALNDPEFKGAVADVVATLHATMFDDQPLFKGDSIVDPFTVLPEFGLLSADGTSARVPARILYHAGATGNPIAELKAAVDGPRQRHRT